MINEYLDSWIKKRIDYELQVKGKAKINGDGWRKLRNYHLKSYLKQLQNVYYSELEKRNEKMGLKKAENN